MIIYALFQEFIWWFLTLFLIFLRPSKKLYRLLKLRTPQIRRDTLAATEAILSTWRSTIPGPHRLLWVHVASSGELEQAIPPLRALVESQSAKVFLTYFSPSAEPFLKNVPGLVGSLGFPPDSPRIHKEILNTLGITDVILVRYDLWPGLVYAASSLNIPIHLFAATADNTKNNLFTPLSRLLKEHLFRRMKTIFAVTGSDRTYFEGLRGNAKVHLAGDPKWSRARDRAASARAQRAHSRIGWFLDLCDRLKIERGLVVFGSPHREEHGVALECVALRQNLAMVYVPHEVGSDHIAALAREITALGARTTLFSTLESHPPTLPDFDVVIVDRVGFLAELYAIADAAVVGGGFDGQVHNTLEPAAHPVPTLFGTNVNRAREARQLLESGGALGFATPQDMLYFLKRCFQEPSSISVIRAESDHPLAVARKRAAAAFAEIPDTSEIVCAALARQVV